MTVTKGRLRIDWHLPDDFRVQTQNLDLVPANQQLADTDWRDRTSLSSALKAEIPDEWPPELVRDDSSPDGEGWWDWYVVKRDGDQSKVIGVMGLKGWPDVSRSIQIGCSFLPEFQKHGHGTEAVDGIASWTLSQPSVECVTAETPVDNHGAAKVLRTLGFVQVDADDHSLLRFEKRRDKSAAA
jgi:[ribosomal protein S5]-alanine N-acetyltransferase